MNLCLTLKLSQPQEKWHANILHNFLGKLCAYHTFSVQNGIYDYRMLELKASQNSPHRTAHLSEVETQDPKGKEAWPDLLMV